MNAIDKYWMVSNYNQCNTILSELIHIYYQLLE